MKRPATKLGRPYRLPVLSDRYFSGALIAGKYRLEAQLGEGGMGTVWLARNETLDAPVALKLIRSDLRSEDGVERLLLEAQVEAKLKHPNIVRVFDFGQTGLGDAFIVMEVLDGISLDQLLEQRGRLRATEAVQLVLPVIGALCHAHENGVVHRDIKPQNIFLDRGGLHAGTKLLDFGIAKLTGAHCHRNFTERGSLLGSPAYMAPEQAKGLEDVDHRADIWALCVVLYEAISGTPAFPGEGYVVLRNVIEAEVPALEDTGAGELVLWQILSRGLNKDPARRFQSMRQLGTALAQWLCDRGESEDLDGNGISRRWGVVPAVALASASVPGRLDAGSSPSGVRPRRSVQILELAPGAGESFARALRRRMSPRAAAVLRIGLALACSIAVVLAPSKVRVEPATSASARPNAEQVQTAATEQGPIHLVGAASSEQPASEAVSTRATPPTLTRESHAPIPSRRSSRHVTETDLGLKAPY